VTATILVVDDDPSIRRLLAELFKSEGYRSLAAADGPAALKVAGRDPPDLVVTDVWMPGMDGLTLAAKLTEQQGGALPVLFMSAGPCPDSVPLARFLPKPFDLSWCLQAVEQLLPAAPLAMAGAALPAGIEAPTPGPVVLLIEDEPATAVVVRDLLEPAGYVVQVAETGAAGLARLDAGGVDLVLLDLVLPDLDGLEVCLRVRAHEDAVYLPILMLTARDGEAQRRQSFAVGADDYVTKPFRNEELLDRVQVWLRVRQRLKDCNERLVQDVERRAHHEAVVAMACAAGEQLRQPLTMLLGGLERWRAGRLSAEDLARVDADLQDAANDLLVRVEALDGVGQYETQLFGSVAVLDLDRAAEPSPPAPA
jgi:DNA-binding response OmpR family regulator